MCCKTMSVGEIDKPANKWCQHCDLRGVHGCKIYETRPAECANYQCLWLASHVRADLTLKPMAPEYKPSVCGIILSYTVDEQGITAYINLGVDWRAGTMGKFLIDFSNLPRKVVLIEGNRRQVLWRGEILGEHMMQEVAA
jgi:hypothetical protein